MRFVREASAGRSHHDNPAREAERIEEQKVDAEASDPQIWDGVCLVAEEGR
jgi:hypothetical protein